MNQPIRFLQPVFDGDDIPIWIHPQGVAFLVDMAPDDGTLKTTLVSFGGDSRCVRGSIEDVTEKLWPTGKVESAQSPWVTIAEGGT